jgi:hypothetical protein
MIKKFSDNEHDNILMYLIMDIGSTWVSERGGVRMYVIDNALRPRHFVNIGMLEEATLFTDCLGLRVLSSIKVVTRV